MSTPTDLVVAPTLADFALEPIPEHAFPSDATLRLAKRIAVQLVSYPPQTYAFRGKLDAFELLWPIDGEIEFLGGHIAGPDQLGLLTPGRRYIFATGPRHVRAVVVQFQIDRYPRSWRSPNHWPRLRAMPESDICRPLLCYLLTHARSREPLVIRPALVMLISAFVTNQTLVNLPARPEIPPLLRKMLAFILQELHKSSARISPDTIAAAIGVNRSTVFRSFDRHFGITPHAFIRNARLDRAVELLARTDLPIGHIALLTGFYKDSHMGRYLQRHFNMTPRQLRRRLRSGNTPYPQPRCPLLIAPWFSHHTPEPADTISLAEPEVKMPKQIVHTPKLRTGGGLLGAIKQLVSRKRLA